MLSPDNSELQGRGFALVLTPLNQRIMISQLNILPPERSRRGQLCAAISPDMPR